MYTQHKGYPNPLERLKKFPAILANDDDIDDDTDDEVSEEDFDDDEDISADPPMMKMYKNEIALIFEVLQEAISFLHELGESKTEPGDAANTCLEKMDYISRRPLTY